MTFTLYVIERFVIDVFRADVISFTWFWYDLQCLLNAREASVVRRRRSRWATSSQRYATSSASARWNSTPLIPSTSLRNCSPRDGFRRAWIPGRIWCMFALSLHHAMICVCWCVLQRMTISVLVSGCFSGTICLITMVERRSICV